MSILSDIGSMIGLTPDIASAIAAAELDPTSANLRAVVSAYAANGQTPPAPLMAELIQANNARYPYDTFTQNTMLPVLVIGGLILFWILRRK